MNIPNNIKKEHIDKAIEEIKHTGIPNERLSYNYFLKIGDLTLPPKYVISIANKYANGIELQGEEFYAVEAKNYLKNLDFNIIEDTKGFYPQLTKFLSQALTNNLTTSHYEHEYLNLNVKVGFGQGNQAKVPWIAFLKDKNTVQKGIYPVYLYYKDKKILILAYGISETIKPDHEWNLNGVITIEQYFLERGIGRPDRYGKSYVFKSYNIDNWSNAKVIDQDLAELINIYKSDNMGSKSKLIKSFFYSDLYSDVLKIGLKFNKQIILRFSSSLLTKPFVILTGLSGSGKTKLAQAFSTWICSDQKQYCLVPVGADWTNREPLLGFPNALEYGKYIKPDNGVLDLVLRANENAQQPYFLILDEMNLSHVERYFADFLSVMESHGKILLHPGDENWNEVPPEIHLPDNLFIIGTVNIDETTYMFSPKVLDRASVIEFRITSEEMAEYLSNPGIIDMEQLDSAGSDMAEDFVKIAKDKTLIVSNPKVFQTSLIDFFKELKKTGAEFGYRSASEINRFAAIVNKLEPEWTSEQIIDAAIMQKLLPKVHGSKRKLEPVLKTLGKLCLQESANIDDYLSPKAEVDFTEKTKIKYPVSLEKILRMYRGLTDNGFTSYAEA